MSGIASTYTTAIHENFRPLFANWEPGRPVRFGDYGPVENHSLLYVGNIADLGIKFRIREDNHPDHKLFSSKGSTEVNFHAKGEHYAKAALSISFKTADSVFFNAAECRHSLIEDKTALGRQIMKLYGNGKWKKSWAILTDIVNAGATTVAVSGGDSSSLVLESSTGDWVNLADVAAKLTVSFQKNVGFQLIAEAGLTPLIGLCQIQSPFLGLYKDFNPLTLSRPANNLPEPEAEDHPDAVYFAQLR